MLRLRTFGGLSLESDHGPIGGAGAQRRRLGLLAVLAEAGERGLTRDKLIGLLWPEVDETRARSALSQALYALKRDTGENHLVLGYDRLALNPATLTSDVAEFEQAIARGDPAAAAVLYAGAFLDGLHLAAAPEFEHWLDGARLRLGRIAERALERLAIDAAARGDHTAATDWWRRLTALDPLKASVVLRLMEALVRGGDRAGALREAERYVERAHEELGGAASTTVAAYADTLRGEAEPHRVTDRFLIERELERGDTAVVFLARDVKHDRHVALMMLDPALCALAGRERLAREIRLGARLQHPNVLPLHEAGEWADTLYVVTPFVDGESLRERIAREGPLAIPDALLFARETADALEHAHRHGVVHGDLTPANVMLADGHAIVADFGIARLLAGNADARPADDIHRLGAVLYEMLAGTPPWTDARARSRASRRSSTAPSLRSIRPSAPPWVDELVRRMLAPEPDGRPATAGEVARALVDGASGPPSRLPLVGDAMIGREPELREACALLDRPDVGTLTLTGPGGVGKTRLAIQAARERESLFDRVYFVDLSSVRDADGVAPAIVAEVGLALHSDQRPLDAFASACAGRRTLLVLDNFEQVIGAAPAVARLAAAAPTLKILVTSRMHLGIPGECEMQVAPLFVPDERDDSAALRESPAIRLFMRRASDASAALVFDDEDVRAAAQICARFDGLPLAIELAAARCRLMGPRAVAARLESGLRLLSGGGRQRPERHQTMRRAIAWSYALLSTEEQRLFVRLAIFAGGCTVAAAESVCADPASSLDVLDGIAALIDASAVVRDVPTHDGQPRLRMLATVREFALESLATSAEADTIARRHAEWYVELARSLAPLLVGEAQHRALTTLAAEHANFAAALDFLVECGDAEAALRLGASLWRYWLVRGHLAEGRLWLARMLALPMADGPPLEGLRADALTGSGHLAQIMGATDEAARYFHAALEIRQALGDHAGVANALADLGWIRWRQCDFREARRLSSECLALAVPLDATRVAALALTNLGAAALFEGHFGEACAMFARSAALREQVSDRRGVAYANTLLAWATCRIGSFEEALDLLESAEDTLRAVNDQRLVYLTRDVRAEVYLRQGDGARAAATLEIADVSRSRRFGDRWSVAHGLALASWAARLLGQVQQATTFAEESLALRRAEGDRYGEAESLALLAYAARLNGDEARCATLLRSSRAIRADIGDAAGLAECEAELATEDVSA